MKVRVAHDGPYGDWVMACAEHDIRTTTGDQELAYEAALGHVCLHHPKPTQENDVRPRITAHTDLGTDRADSLRPYLLPH